MITYDDLTHTYTKKDGSTLPSVTQIISHFFPLDPKIPKAYIEAAGQRGTALHTTLEYLDQGILNEYDPSLQWAIDAWTEWKVGKEILEIERIVYNDLYAGRIDRVVRYGNKVAIVDIKTSSFIKLAPLQLHAYWSMTLGMGFPHSVSRLLVVQMREEKLKEIEIDVDEDILTMMEGMALLYTWKQKNKL